MSGGFYRPKGRNTFRVWIPWKGKKLFINQYLDGTPLYSDGQAKRVLERIRGEIDQKTFDPANWGKDKAIIFQNAWEIYQKQAQCGETRLEDRERVKRDHLMPYFEDWLLPDIEEHNIKDFFSKLPASFVVNIPMRSEMAM